MILTEILIVMCTMTGQCVNYADVMPGVLSVDGSSAQLDAEMAPGAVVEQDVDNRRILLNGAVIGAYPDKD